MTKLLPWALALSAALGLAGCKTASPAPSCQSWQCADGAVRLDPPRANGLSGQFRPADGGPAVRFSTEALPDGAAEPKGRAEARYELAGGQRLVVRLTGPEQASLQWGGVELAGFGALTGKEQAALSDLAQSPIAPAMAAVTLFLGCRQDVRPADLAALLFPWQMLFKYRGGAAPEARVAAIRALGARSPCGYFQALSPGGPLQLAEDNPLPAVFGYFPFDAAGSDEPAAATPKEVKP
ncbi:MAG TPA: hypothetical protein VGK67_07390 [Myxococcales bacterium]|jgi:hypothetical protein